mgnify:CR=1 FL=1
MTIVLININVHFSKKEKFLRIGGVSLVYFHFQFSTSGYTSKRPRRWITVKRNVVPNKLMGNRLVVSVGTPFK